MNQSPDVLSLLLNTAVLVLRGGEPPGGIPRGSPFRRLFDTTACCRVASGIMALTPLVSGDPTYHDTMLEIFRVLVDSLVSGRKWTAVSGRDALPCHALLMTHSRTRRGLKALSLSCLLRLMHGKLCSAVHCTVASHAGFSSLPCLSYVLRKYDPSLDLPPPRSTMPVCPVFCCLLCVNGLVL